MKKLVLGFLLVLGMTATSWATPVAHYDLTVPGGLNYGYIDISLNGDGSAHFFAEANTPGYYFLNAQLIDFNQNGTLLSVLNLTENGTLVTSGFTVDYGSSGHVNGWGTFNTQINNIGGLAGQHISTVAFDLDGAYVPLIANGDGHTVAAHIWDDSVGNTFFVTDGTPVPEPGTLLLLGAGFLSLAIYGKRRRNA